MADFFKDFELTTIRVGDGALRLRRGGSGPPLLLLHGNPQTHAMWHAVAPALAESFTLVCPDLRGYGGSFKPGPTADHAPYAKVAMARDMAELMATLGHERFGVVSHDRGARVAHRLAIDNPGRVQSLAVMDIVPTVEHFERTDMAFALGYYHWFWFAQPHPFPEDLIKPPGFFRKEALTDYLAAVRNPDMITGMCEDYRAAISTDLEHDRASRAEGRRVECPMLVLWGAKGYIGKWYDPLVIWREYCSADVTGCAVNSGHYLAEEAPEEVLAHLRGLLS